MSDMIPYFRVLEELRLEDNAFIFDDQAQQLPNLELSPHAILPKFLRDTRVRRASRNFIVSVTLYTSVKLGVHVRLLHWKIATPFVHKHRPRVFDTEALPEEKANIVVEAIKRDMQREDEAEELEMKMKGHDGFISGWSLGDNNNDVDEVQGQPPEATTGPAGGHQPRVITPSLSFVRSWKHLTHIETTTGSVYGLPAALLKQRYMTRVLSRYLEILVLEERWQPGCGPQDSLLALYRSRLYNDLKFVARGVGFPRLRSLIFVPDNRAGYWSRLPERLEWVRDPTRGIDLCDPFPEMKAILEAEGERATVDRQQVEWSAIWGGLNARF